MALSNINGDMENNNDQMTYTHLPMSGIFTDFHGDESSNLYANEYQNQLNSTESNFGYSNYSPTQVSTENSCSSCYRHDPMLNNGNNNYPTLRREPMDMSSIQTQSYAVDSCSNPRLSDIGYSDQGNMQSYFNMSRSSAGMDGFAPEMSQNGFQTLNCLQGAENSLGHNTNQSTQPAYSDQHSVKSYFNMSRSSAGMDGFAPEMSQNGFQTMNCLQSAENSNGMNSTVQNTNQNTQPSYSDQDRSTSYFNMSRNSAGMDGFAPQMSQNVSQSAENNNEMHTMNQNAQPAYSNSLPMQYMGMNLNNLSDNKTNYWSYQDTDDNYANDSLQTQTVYSADFQTSGGTGNNFNHFPNSDFRNMHISGGLSEDPSPCYTAESVPQVGNYEFGGVSTDMCDTQAYSIYGLGDVGRMQAQSYPMGQAN